MLAPGLFLHAGNHLPRQGLRAVDNDVGLFVHYLIDGAPQAYRRAHAVKIRKLMAHYKDSIAGPDMVRQRCRNDPGAHLVPLFHTFREAAEELICIIFLFDGDLVAAAAQSHIKRPSRPKLPLLQAGGPAAHADGNGGALVVLIFNIANFIEDGEAAVHHSLNVLLVGQYQIALPVQPLEKAVHIHGPGIQLSLHLRADAGILCPGAFARQLLPVVKANQKHHRAGQRIFLVDFLIVGVVHKIQYNAFTGTRAVHSKLAVIHRNVRAAVLQDLGNRFRV